MNTKFIAAVGGVIILVFVAFSIRNMVRGNVNTATNPVAPRPSAVDAIERNERGAVVALRSIVKTETVFADRNDGKYGSLDQLAEPFDSAVPPLDRALATGKKGGYAFQIEVSEAGPGTDVGYKCIAKPIQPGKSGVKQFFVDETGAIRFTQDGATPKDDSQVYVD